MNFHDMSQTELDKIGIIKGEQLQGCLICHTPTPFIEICAEAHFCSIECMNKFYDEFYGAMRNRTFVREDDFDDS